MFFTKRRLRSFRGAAGRLPSLIQSGRTAVPGLVVLAVLLLVRALGGLQGIEWRTLDTLLRLRPAEPVDERILIVGIDDEDLRQTGTYPISDRNLTDLLQTLQSAPCPPRTIGVDIFRDLPVAPGHDQLSQTLSTSPTVIGVEKVLNNPVAAPPALPAEQVGFVDLVLDTDGFIRRILLGTPDAQGDYHFAFSVRLAEHYLALEGIELSNGLRDSAAMRFGDTELTRFRPDSGGYVRGDGGGNQMLLNVRSGPKPFHSVTLRQVMAGEVPAEWICDRTVLIGITALSAKDMVNSAAVASDNPGLVYGVEIHAHALSQILSAVLEGRPLLRVWPEGLELLWVGLWGALGAGLVYRARTPIASLLGGGSLLLVLLGSSYGLLLAHTWVPMIAPLCAFVGVGMATMTARQFQAQQQQQMTMRLLGQQTSPEIAQALWEGRHYLTESGRLPGRSLTATLLFSDIRGFTTLAEQHPPQQVMGWLNEYFTAMTEVVQQHHGVVNKFLGDGLMAVFGVPIPRQSPDEIAQDARRAVACALAMGQQLEVLNQARQQQGVPTLEIRVGIFTGPVMVGSVGGRQRLEYGVVGDSVNTAARLESCEKERQPSPCRILIAEETLAYLTSDFKIEAWGEVALKGKQKMLTVYRVVEYQA